MLYIKGKPCKPPFLPASEVRWEPLIPWIVRANRALSYYDGALNAVPNPDVLLSPLTTQEAVLSSQIEGTQATLGDVLRFDAGEEPEQASLFQDIGEVINYRRALNHAKIAVAERPFNLNLLLELHYMLLDSVRGRAKRRGEFRREQNWIGPKGCPIEKADFIPPVADEVPSLMTNWENYYHAEDPDALVQLAMVHAQFEIIHPFLDGNGRLGRMIVPLYMFEKRLLSHPMFYISQYFEERREEYITCLRTIGSEPESWNRWIVFFLEAVTLQAGSNAEKAAAIRSLYEDLKKRVLEITHSQFAIPLLDVLFHKPIIQTADIKARRDMPSTPMVMKLLTQFDEAGIISLIRKSVGRTPGLYAFTDLLNICEGKNIFP